MLARIAGLQNTLASSLDVPGFTLVPELPVDPLGEDGLRQVLAGPLALRVGESRVTFRGDAEAGAAFTLIDRWDRGRQTRRVAGRGFGPGAVSYRSIASRPIGRSISAPATGRPTSRSTW